MVQIIKYSQQKSFIKAMIAWDVACGKTTLASTLPKPLFVCTENGLLTIADKNPLAIEVNSILDLRDTLKYLKAQLALPLDKRDAPFESVVIDSLSAMSTAIKNNITNNGQQAMDMRKWGTLADQLMGLFIEFIKLPTNVVFLVHTAEKEDEDTKKTYYNLSLEGSAKEKVLREFDIIAYIFKKEDGTRVISVKESPYTKAKCRSQALKAVENLPFDLTEWLKIINKDASTEPQKVVAKVNERKPAPSKLADDAWAALQDKLVEDSTLKNKEALVQAAKDSTKLSDQDKDWLAQMILSY